MTERIDATLYVPKTNPDAVEQYQAFEPWSNYFSSIEQSSKANDFEHEDGGMFCVVKNQDGYNLGKVTMVGFQPTDQVTDGAFVPACGEGLYTFGENSYKFTSICDHACDNNKEIKSVDLSALKYLFTIGTYAFHKATNLASIQLPITSINRPNDILIKDIALAWTKIEQIVLTKNVKITSEAFESCPLKWIDAVDDHLWYSSDEGILYDKEKTTLITVPSKYETEVIDFLPYTLKTIGDYAFAYTGVTKVRIPYGTTNIGTWAFAGCSKLNTLNLPSSVMAIGANALESCYADIYLAAPEPLQGFDENAFPDSNRAKLFVSKHSNTSNYRTHESTKYFSSIEQSSKANDFEHEDGGMFCVLNPATETQPGEVTMVGFQPTDQVTDGAFVPACGDGLYTLGGKDYKFIDICEDACEENLELKSIDLSNLHDLRFINGGAFNKSGLSHVALPNNAPVVTQITGTAFDYTSITSLALTKSIKMRAYPMFGHCNQLEWIDVDESNSYHTSFQGMLFDKEQTLLMACPKAYRGQENGNTDKLINQFPSTIVNIESYAFSNCSGIERVELPYGLESLFGSAFNNCNALQAIKIPSSVQRIYGSVFSDCSSLREVAMAATTPANFSNPYSAFPNNAHMTLYVPKTNPNAVEEYRAHEAFANFETIERHSKANDFEHEDGGMFCVLTPASETEPGEVAMVGFQPTEQVTDGAFAPACGEGYYTFGGKNYNFTAISNDACYANTHLLSFDFSQLNKLTSIGEKAFAECRNLNELLIGHNEECSFGANFYGNNSQDFKCFVRWTDYRKFKNMVNTWSMLEGETKHPVEHLNSYVQVDEDKELCAFSVGHPVDWNASGLDAYAITSYNRSEEMGTASPVSYSPAGIGLIIEGLEGDVVYKLERPTGNTSVPQNFLVGTADGEADAFTKTVGYVFNESRKCFTRPTASTIVPEGSAYLRISNTLAGNTTKITIDLWPESGLLGDVNGDGNVDVTDVTCLINKVLGSAAYPDDVCDINGNGIIDVSDISDLILLVIG
ncbi:MAG: leucine-rich repeat protein [Bacteroidales bacterium]|nr:leucine-rich repeat protein [Bacteroidales bacterium]